MNMNNKIRLIKQQHGISNSWQMNNHSIYLILIEIIQSILSRSYIQQCN